MSDVNKNDEVVVSSGIDSQIYTLVGLQVHSKTRLVNHARAYESHCQREHYPASRDHSFESQLQEELSLSLEVKTTSRPG